MALGIIAAAVALVVAQRVRTGKWALPDRETFVWVKNRIAPEEKLPRVIYLTAYPPFLLFLGCNAGNLLLWHAAGPFVLGAVVIILQASLTFLVLLYRVFPLTSNQREETPDA